MKESADSVVFLQVAKGRYQRPLTSREFYRFMKRKTVQTKYDVPVRRAFR